MTETVREAIDGRGPMPATPECNRLHDVKDDSQAIGQFLEWLFDQGALLMAWRETKQETPCRRRHDSVVDTTNTVNGLRALEAEFDDRDPSTVVPLPDPSHPSDCVCKGTGMIVSYAESMVEWRPEGQTAGSPIERILAAYFGIDLAKVEAEKRTVLEWLRGEGG